MSEPTYQPLPISELVPFANHPFKLYKGKRLEDMVESVKANGILVPIVVRTLGDKYEILSGHNRVEAAKIAELDSVPAVVRENLSDDEALLVVTETNLIQRSFADMKHSERAVVIATHYNAMKLKSGYRSDLLQEIAGLTTAPVGRRMETRDKLGGQYGLSKNTIARYLRVNELIGKLKDMLDDGAVAMRTAVSLSYLKAKEQELVWQALQDESAQLTMRKAEELRDLSGQRELTERTVKKLLKIEPSVVKTTKVKISSDVMSRYFGEERDAKEVEDVVAKALEAWFANN
ncbi:stage 0 sporulation protein J [Clostridia bacterium]|nr:stage 0 sporulation protein J [Clostridia bacterium]